MTYNRQLHALQTLFAECSQRGDDWHSITLENGQAALDGIGIPAPRAFLHACRSSGWMTLPKSKGSRIYPTGLLFLLSRNEWDRLMPGFQSMIESVFAVLSKRSGGEGYEIDEISDSAGVRIEDRPCVWSTLLACMPGIASYHSWSWGFWDPYERLGKIRLNEEVLDMSTMMRSLEIAKDWSPSVLSLPLGYEPDNPESEESQ